MHHEKLTVRVSLANLSSSAAVIMSAAVVSSASGSNTSLPCQMELLSKGGSAVLCAA